MDLANAYYFVDFILMFFLFLLLVKYSLDTPRPLARRVLLVLSMFPLILSIYSFMFYINSY